MPYYNLVFTSYAQDDDSNPFVLAMQYLTPEVIPSSVTASNLAEAFWDNVVDGAGGWKAVVQIGMDADSVVVTAPQAPTVLGIKVGAVVGTRTGAQMPRFVAWGFKQERARADIRAGFKRVGLISESDTSGQVPTAGMLTILNTFGTILSTPLSVSDGIDFYDLLPIVVKRIKYTAPSGKPAYRLPEGLDPFEYYLANEWTFQRITTQNSRKK